jgi:hypothetical protein
MSKRAKPKNATRIKIARKSAPKPASSAMQRRRGTSVKPSAAPPEKQIDGFIAKFDARVGQLIRECRAILRKRFPTAIELVYDNYNFFVIGFATTERTSTALFSIAANAHGIVLSFYWGATLPDPHKILQGSGSQNRFVRLPDAQALSDPRIVALLNDAVAQAKFPLGEAPGYTIIKSVSAKQRPRRL